MRLIYLLMEVFSFFRTAKTLDSGEIKFKSAASVVGQTNDVGDGSKISRSSSQVQFHYYIFELSKQNMMDKEFKLYLNNYYRTNSVIKIK